ncbi:MAG: potassium channel family protein, partial [Bacteroidota bacterium]
CFYILLLLQLTFALNYLTLSKISNDAFKGIDPSEDIISLFGNCFYFSTITFATIGYGDITPNCLSAKMLVTLETLASMIFIIFIFANFSNFKSDFTQNSPGIGHLEEMDE